MLPVRRSSGQNLSSLLRIWWCCTRSTSINSYLKHPDTHIHVLMPNEPLKDLIIINQNYQWIAISAKFSLYRIFFENKGYSIQDILLKYIFCEVLMTENSYKFEMTWGCLNINITWNFGCTIPLKNTVYIKNLILHKLFSLDDNCASDHESSIFSWADLFCLTWAVCVWVTRSDALTLTLLKSHYCALQLLSLFLLLCQSASPSSHWSRDE